MIGQLRERGEDDVPKGHGQSNTNPQLEGKKDNDSLMKDHDTEEELKDAPWKTCGIKWDYHLMNDPYSEEKDLFYVAQMEAILAGDNICKMFGEGKQAECILNTSECFRHFWAICN